VRRHDLILAGRVAHLRRKLRKAFKAHDPRAARPMALVYGLNRVEEFTRLVDLDADGATRSAKTAPSPT